MTANATANRGMLNVCYNITSQLINYKHTHAYPVPIRSRERTEGQTTRTYLLSQKMKSVLGWCNSNLGSAVPRVYPGEDIVYSPIKYRETEGIKETKRRA